LVARRNEGNCAGSQKRIFKDKKYLKDFQGQEIFKGFSIDRLIQMTLALNFL